MKRPATARPFVQLFGVWCKDLNDDKGDWARPAGNGMTFAVIAFQSKRLAGRAAARWYGFSTYTAAKRAGWVEVRPLTKGGVS